MKQLGSINVRLALGALVVLLASGVASCGPDAFEQRSFVSGLRILAARASLPYAKPGESVRLEALVHDARENPPEPMRVFWFPVPCVDPPGGKYFDCYPAFEAAYPLGVDLAPRLVEGTDASMTIPADALANFQPTPGGSTEPLATAYAFVIACGGHPERIQRTTALAENSLPVGCFSKDGQRLDAVSSVFGFTRITISTTRRNTHPNLENMTFHDGVVDRERGVMMSRCELGFLERECDNDIFNIAFSDDAAEIDPDNVGPNGEPGRETLFVDWYTTYGKFTSDRVIVYDPYEGRPPTTKVEFVPPKSAGRGVLWAVLHDNRGGVSWVRVPLTVE